MGPQEIMMNNVVDIIFQYICADQLFHEHLSQKLICCFGSY